jgi:hypothetical protein
MLATEDANPTDKMSESITLSLSAGHATGYLGFDRGLHFTPELARITVAEPPGD